MKIAAIILAGGKSSRMGTNKAELPYSNARLIDYVANEIRQSGIEDIYVSGLISGFDCIVDEIENGGPMIGIISSIGLLYNDFDYYLITPVDLPNINSSIFKLMQESINIADVVYFNNIPLPFLITKCDKLRDLIRSNKYHTKCIGKSVKAFLREFKANIVETNKSINTALLNANSPDDWNLATGLRV